MAFPENQRPAPFARIRPLLLGLFIAATALGLGVNILQRRLPGWFPNPDLLLIASGALTLLASLAARRLPAQNIMAIAILTGAAFPVVWTLAHAAAIPPLSRMRYSALLGASPLGSLPWAVPLLWILLLLSARETTSLLMGKYRGRSLYGISLIFLSTFFVTLLELSLVPYAVKTKGYWSWENDANLGGEFGAPWSYFACSAAISACTLFLVVPWFINKRQAPAKIDPIPALVWSILGAYFGVNGLLHGFRVAGTISLISVILVMSLLCTQLQKQKSRRG